MDPGWLLMGPGWLLMGPRLVIDGPRLVTEGYMAKTSTIRSDEDTPRPGSTLSYPIVQFHPFGADSYFLALNLEYRKEQVVLKTDKTTV